jgi:sulfite exporter TauE/SafE
VCGALTAIWRAPSLYRSALIGGVNGLLPCGLAFAVLLHLASYGSVTAVISGAYVFGFSTLPGLLAVSWLGRRWSASRRRWLVRASGVALILFGILTIVRGRPEVHHWFHRHLLIERAAITPRPHEHHP